MATIASDAPYREFALRLAGLREKSGMSRSQLAEKCGIAARSIINYENGTRIPFGDTCARMAEAFGITTDELLGVSRAASVKAGAVADMRTFGPKAPERLRQALDTIGSTFAGGELEEEQMEEYVLEMRPAEAPGDAHQPALPRNRHRHGGGNPEEGGGNQSAASRVFRRQLILQKKERRHVLFRDCRFL